MPETKPKTERRRTTETTLKAIAICIAAVVLGWQFGIRIADERLELMQEELKSYRQVEGAQLPQLSSDLRSLSHDLGLQLKEQKAVGELERERERTAALEAQLKLTGEQHERKESSLIAENETLRKQVSQLIPNRNDIAVKRGETGELIKNHVFVGVESVYDGWANVNIGDKSISLMSVGNAEIVSWSGKRYKLTMTRLNYETKTCTFAFLATAE